MSRGPSRQPLPQNIRVWGAVMHLSGLVPVLLGPFPPGLYLLVPFVVWRLTRDHHGFVDDQGRSLLNFQISMQIYLMILLMLSLFLLFVTCSFAFTNNARLTGWENTFTILVYAVVGLYALAVLFQICAVAIGALRALRGETYRYPLSLTFLEL
jgi:uncharacterized protein